ncbi:uncharacterized protein LOC144761269 [Lissotriton helveticus]
MRGTHTRARGHSSNDAMGAPLVRKYCHEVHQPRPRAPIVTLGKKTQSTRSSDQELHNWHMANPEATNSSEVIACLKKKGKCRKGSCFRFEMRSGTCSTFGSHCCVPPPPSR